VIIFHVPETDMPGDSVDESWYPCVKRHKRWHKEETMTTTHIVRWQGGKQVDKKLS